MAIHNGYDKPSLYDAKTETYRLVWSSSFDGWKVIRIEEKDGHFKAIKKVSPNHKDTVGLISEFEISKEKWMNIVNTLEAKGFWTYQPFINRRGLDGSGLVIEGYKPLKDKCTLRNYHEVYRWSPNDSTFISMCELFFELKDNEKFIE